MSLHHHGQVIMMMMGEKDHGYDGDDGVFRENQSFKTWLKSPQGSPQCPRWKLLPPRTRLSLQCFVASFPADHSFISLVWLFVMCNLHDYGNILSDIKYIPLIPHQYHQRESTKADHNCLLIFLDNSCIFHDCSSKRAGMKKRESMDIVKTWMIDDKDGKGRLMKG